MTEFEVFFQELDRLWAPGVSDRLPLRVIGSAALFLQTDYARTTRDGDVLETVHVTGDLKHRLIGLAGKHTPLHARIGIYLDIVAPGLPFLPHGPLFHGLKALNGKLRHFAIEVLDVTDVVVSKLKRFNQNDADDVRAMIDKNLVGHARLIERFKDAVDGCFSLDSRADDLPKIVKNLNRVERDLFRVKESHIDLPEWMQERE